MFDLVAPLSIGFIGSLHCLGMCGPLVLAYSLHLEKGPSASSGPRSVWKSGFWHHLAFHLGRTTTYGLLGAMAALVFTLADLGRLVGGLRGSMTLIGGILMVLLGLILLRVLPVPPVLAALPFGSDSLPGRSISRLLRSQGIGAKISLGLATGFLPCGLSWAMIVKAGTTQSSTAGFLYMTAFGLGTVPALFLIGFSASMLSLKTRLLGERAAAAAVIIMGMILIFKGAKAII